MKKEDTVLFLGDVVPYKPFRFRNDLRTVINLECPITQAGDPISGKINLSVRESYLNSIFGSNLMFVSLSNNHILDYGPEGLNSTLAELTKLRIDYFGINTPSEKNHNPRIVELSGKKVAFMSAICESTSPVLEFDDFNYLMLLEPEVLIARIKEIRPVVNRIILYVHWGIEESSLPSAEDVRIARRLVDAGVDIIIGSHAHAPQPVEKYGNGIIAYNLGNFIMPSFDKMPSYFNDEGTAQSDYSKRLMIWNRVSWGLAVDLNTMEFKIKKYLFIANRITEPSITPLDGYMDFSYDISDPGYLRLLKRHMNKRSFYRKLRNFVHEPHVPQMIRRTT